MAKRGRKSAAELSVKPIASPYDGAVIKPPDELDAAASGLWKEIMASRPRGFFSPGDLPLMREYCYNVATLIPRIDAALESDPDTSRLDARDKLVRQSLALARSLRICVSSRTRADSAKAVEMNPGPLPWEERSKATR